MNLLSDKPLDYLGIKDMESKKTGKPFSIVAFGDSQNYQQFEFFKPDKLDLSSLTIGQKVLLEFTVSRRGFQTNFDLVAVHNS